MTMVIFSVFDQKYPFLEEIFPENQNLLLKLKYST